MVNTGGGGVSNSADFIEQSVNMSPVWWV